MPLFGNQQGTGHGADARRSRSPERGRHRRGEPADADVRLGQSCLEFVATGTAVRRLADEHKLPDTTPKPTFTLGLDN